MAWIILDRDGVINKDYVDYVKNVEEWEAIPGSMEAIARLYGAGFHIVVATNQSGIARGIYSEGDLEKIHKLMHEQVEERGGFLEGVFYCPHAPEDACLCRKPLTGLLDEIEQQFEMDLTGVPFVGDSLRDLEAAIAKGCDPILVRTGKGRQTYNEVKQLPQFQKIPVYDDLLSFVECYLKEK